MSSIWGLATAEADLGGNKCSKIEKTRWTDGGVAPDGAILSEGWAQ